MGCGLGLEIFNAKRFPLTNDQVKSIVEIEEHPEVRHWLYIDVNEDTEKEFRGYRRFFKNLPRRKDVDVLVAKYDGRIVGFLALWRLEEYMAHVASIGISVHPDYWGKGVASHLMKSAIKLASERGFKRLEIETLAENAAMRRIAERFGFIPEGIKVKRILKDGTYHDEVPYFLLLDDT